MKLRNKKTGEIMPASNIAVGIGKNGKFYDSLAELNEEWEDYEEPKEYWHIFGTNITKSQEGLDELYDKRNKEIGNYFETQEEAEQAVEKLKALKLLKDKGFKITGWGFRDDEVGIFIRANCPSNTVDELELLFGGEE